MTKHTTLSAAVLTLFLSMALPWHQEAVPSSQRAGTPSIRYEIDLSGPGSQGLNSQSLKTSNLNPYEEAFREMARRLYVSSGLKGILDQEGFERSVAAYYNLKDLGLVKKDVLVIIDYRKPSNQDRLFVIDMKRRQLKYKSLVAHGKNSGLIRATRFSNRPGSHMSSLGVFITGETYRGRHGYSLNIHGMEKGVNHLAEKRRIVIHGADYVSWRHIRKYGHLGRSFGCPAVPKKLARPIIDTIKEGSCIVILGGDQHYYSRSKLYSYERAAQFIASQDT